jgi:hypothetical protein
MPDSMIHPGAILVEDGIPLPRAIQLERKLFSQNWRLVQDQDANALEAKLTAHWTFFYMAGEIRSFGFGFDPEKRIQSAMGHIIQEVRSQQCNCLEITRLSTKSFLGIPYVSVGAHARHIQDGLQFHGR